MVGSGSDSPSSKRTRRRVAPAPAPRRRRLRVLAACAVAGAGSIGLLWVGIHRDPTLGPALADAARAVVGPRAVAVAEDVAYGLQDRFDRWRYRNAAPKAYWSGAPAKEGSATAAPAGEAAPPDEAAAADVEPAVELPEPEPPAPAPDAPPFPPPAFTPPHRYVALPGDGTWIPIADAVAPEAPPAMYKTLIHPDPHRSYAACAVVAIDLDRIALHSVPGTGEPASPTVPRSDRPGMVDPGDAEQLVAAFNGGWQAVHGHWGMRVGALSILPPRPQACTIGIYRDGKVRIRSWPALEPTDADMIAWRQTPPCLVEQGDRHRGLSVEKNTNWGAAVDGQTVIRRSAIGLDGTGRVLFYGMGDGLTASSMAYALAFAGARDVAQLDVNASYPRFLVFGRSEGLGPIVREALVPGTMFKPGEYVSVPERRDFFYLTRRPSPTAHQP
jgi:hypothetical protein